MTLYRNPLVLTDVGEQVVHEVTSPGYTRLDVMVEHLLTSLPFTRRKGNTKHDSYDTTTSGL